MTTWNWHKSTSSHKEGVRVPLKQYRENLETLVERVREKEGKLMFVNICNPFMYKDAAMQTIGNKKILFFNFPSVLEPYLSIVHDRFPDLFVTYF